LGEGHRGPSGGAGPPPDSAAPGRQPHGAYVLCLFPSLPPLFSPLAPLPRPPKGTQPWSSRRRTESTAWASTSPCASPGAPAPAHRPEEGSRRAQPRPRRSRAAASPLRLSVPVATPPPSHTPMKPIHIQPKSPRFVVGGTIEERILKLQEKKQLVGGGGGGGYEGSMIGRHCDLCVRELVCLCACFGVPCFCAECFCVWGAHARMLRACEGRHSAFVAAARAGQGAPAPDGPPPPSRPPPPNLKPLPQPPINYLPTAAGV
jgi:hypothetical protein